MTQDKIKDKLKKQSKQKKNFILIKHTKKINILANAINTMFKFKLL